jgi:hypothetical protein
MLRDPQSFRGSLNLTPQSTTADTWHANTHTLTHAHTYSRIFTRAHTCTRTRTRTNTHTHTHTRTHSHHTSTHAHTTVHEGTTNWCTCILFEQHIQSLSHVNNRQPMSTADLYMWTTLWTHTPTPIYVYNHLNTKTTYNLFRGCTIKVAGIVACVLSKVETVSVLKEL